MERRLLEALAALERDCPAIEDALAALTQTIASAIARNVCR